MKPWQVSAGHTAHLCGGSHFICPLPLALASAGPAAGGLRPAAGSALQKDPPSVPLDSKSRAQLPFLTAPDGRGRLNHRSPGRKWTRKFSHSESPAPGASGPRAPRKAGRDPVDIVRCAGHTRWTHAPPASLASPQDGLARGPQAVPRPRLSVDSRRTPGLSLNRLPFCWLSDPFRPSAPGRFSLPGRAHRATSSREATAREPGGPSAGSDAVLLFSFTTAGSRLPCRSFQ